MKRRIIHFDRGDLIGDGERIGKIHIKLRMYKPVLVVRVVDINAGATIGRYTVPVEDRKELYV
jgi:hypothetical protein